MKNLLLVVMTSAVVLLAATLGLVLQEPAVSTFEIDRDLTAVKADIAAAEEESSKYSGGVIKTLLDLRAAMLRNTVTMLDQKRTSLVRRISLNYTIDRRAIREASDRELEDIIEEIEQAERKVAAAKNEAAQYAGGLLQSMALLKAGTEEVNVSQLRLKFFSAKYGLVLPLPPSDTKTLTRPPGQIVKDREAL